MRSAALLGFALLFSATLCLAGSESHVVTHVSTPATSAHVRSVLQPSDRDEDAGVRTLRVSLAETAANVHMDGDNANDDDQESGLTSSKNSVPTIPLCSFTKCADMYCPMRDAVCCAAYPFCCPKGYVCQVELGRDKPVGCVRPEKICRKHKKCSIEQGPDCTAKCHADARHVWPTRQCPALKGKVNYRGPVITMQE